MAAISKFERVNIERQMTYQLGVPVKLMNNGFRIDYKNIVVRIYKETMSVEVFTTPTEWKSYEQKHDEWRLRTPESMEISKVDWRVLKKAFTEIVAGF
jgi:hypothetical protein